jgi:hypothetical protein
MSSNISISEGQNIREDVERLDCESPDRFSIVPAGIQQADSIDELSLQDNSITIRKIIEREGVEETPIDEGLDLHTHKHRSAEFVGPTIFFAAHFLPDHWEEFVTVVESVQVYLEHLSINEANMSFVVEKDDGDEVSVEYEGPADELDEVLDTIEEIVDD